ncbi:MAG: hypothetical protein CBC12_13475 [Candidatus Puniceispirillum sp. TMED52]|nr:hypothetical protein [SAR116 cluster bacterium]OUU44466.1 MAG: hypothetical protein CBC12_13475 [Candidatus Puniceispirillum sp. TMED52]HCP18308.1 hypothetical protein [Alphaproteobacteria bacterium]|tara:strand:- start:156 stop:563 length:408 start_codon:yes stop_codon:yes gene_type:complete
MYRLANIIITLMPAIFMISMINGKTAFSEEPVCLEPIDKFVDPGYCAGLSIAYLEILDDQNKTQAVEISNAVKQTKIVHEQCHKTKYEDAFALGQTAFHRMLFYITPDRLNKRLSECYSLLNKYRISIETNSANK